MPAQARNRGLGVFAEARDNAAPSLVDDVEPAHQPHEHDQRNEKTRSPERKARARRLANVGAVASLAPAEQIVEATSEVAPDLVEIRRPAAAALSPLRIVEGHGNPCRERCLRW